MTEMRTRPATADEESEWLGQWRARLDTHFAALGGPAEADEVIGRTEQFREAARLRLMTAAGHPIGLLSIRVFETREGVVALLDDITIDAEHRGQGYGREALHVAESWASDRAPRLSLSVYGATPAIDALLGRYPVRALHMVKPLTEKPTVRPGLSWRPITDAEFVGWKEASIEGFAQDVAGSGAATLEEARAGGRAQFGELLPDGPRTPGHSITILEDEGAPVGNLWLHHSRTPHTTFVYGVEVDEAKRGKGYGRAIVLVAEDLTRATGDKRVMLNVFGQNTVAINLYTSLGYTVSAQHRSRIFAEG